MLVKYLFVLIVYTIINPASSGVVEDAFKKDGIVPDVVSAAPPKELIVNYKNGKKATFGNELTPTQVKDQPDIQYDGESDAYYTLVMTDPDAPSRKNPIRREYLHWLVTNIPGNKVSSGEVISAYIGSAPPKGSGFHRYAFLVYQQPSKLNFDEPRRSDTDGNRGNFSVEKFAKKYNLGKPLYGNFYQAQYDDYVPIVHKRLGLRK